MKRARATELLGGLIEQLAAVEHERWSHWQRYMHGHGVRMLDGSLRLPAELVEQWERQIATPYALLSEEEKQSDRDQVSMYLPIIAETFANNGS